MIYDNVSAKKKKKAHLFEFYIIMIVLLNRTGRVRVSI